MTTIKLTIAAIVAIALAGPASAQFGNSHAVEGHYRSDGTYVAPHYRTNPNNSTYDNYNSPGNYNPNTGRTTGGTYTYPRR